MPYEIRRSSDKSEQERRMTSPPERLQRSGGYERCEPKKRRQLVVSPFGATASDHDPSRQTRYETSIGDEQLRAETNSGHGESSERGLEWVKYRGFPQGEEAQTEFLRSSFTKVVQPDVMEKSAELAEIATQLDYEIFYSYAKDGMIKSSIFDTSIGYYRSKLRIPSIDDIASKKTASHQTSEGGNRSQLSDNDKIISKLVTL